MSLCHVDSPSPNKIMSVQHQCGVPLKCWHEGFLVLNAKKSKSRLLKVMVPGADKFAIGRVLTEVLVMPPHEDITDEIERSDDLKTMDVATHISSHEWVSRDKHSGNNRE